MTFDELSDKLDRVQGFGDRRKARCPAHDDNVASLSIREVEDGKILLHCHAGCTPKSIAKHLGISLKDLAGNKGVGGEEVARYDYVSRDGEVLYTKVRYEPKDFRFTPSGYQGERVPYRLPEMIAAPMRHVLWVEGEKDAENLRALGFIATTAGGSQDWRAEMAQYFTGRRVTILPDNDDPGRAHARQVASALSLVASSVAILELPGLPPKGDVSDWLKGKTADDLRATLPTATKWNGRTLRALTDVPTQEPEWLWFPRIAKGAVTIVFGEAGIGKSTVMLDVIARASRGDVMPNGAVRVEKTKTVICGLEGPASRAVKVLQAAGANLANVFVIEQKQLPDPTIGPLEQIDHLEAEMRREGATFLYVDNVSEALLSETDSNSEYSVRAAMRRVVDFAERNNFVVVMVSHPKKGAAFVSVKEAITGSQAFTNLPRTTLFVAPVKDGDGNDTGDCAIAVAKSNLYATEYANTLSYKLQSHEIGWRDGHPILSEPRVIWQGVLPKSAQDLLEDMRPRKDAERGSEGPAKTMARAWLERFAATVPLTGISWEEVMEAAPEGTSEGTLRRLRSAYFTAAGNSRAGGVRWFPKDSPPQTPPLRIREENTRADVSKRSETDVTHSADTTSTLAQVETLKVATSPATSSNETTSTLAQPVAQPSPELSKRQTTAERMAAFMAGETPEQFLARMTRDQKEVVS